MAIINSTIFGGSGGGIAEGVYIPFDVTATTTSSFSSPTYKYTINNTQNLNGNVLYVLKNGILSQYVGDLYALLRDGSYEKIGSVNNSTITLDTYYYVAYNSSTYDFYTLSKRAIYGLIDGEYSLILVSSATGGYSDITFTGGVQSSYTTAVYDTYVYSTLKSTAISILYPYGKGNVVTSISKSYKYLLFKLGTSISSYVLTASSTGSVLKTIQITRNSSQNGISLNV